MSADEKPLISWRMLTTYLVLAVIATILVVIGVADLIESPPSENLGPVGSSERGPIDVVLRPL